jgi:diadenylate cyclase
VSNLRLTADALSPGRDASDLAQEVAPKGMRLLHRVSRLPSATAIAVADHFGGLAKLQRATVDDLMTVDGVDEATARAIRDTLSRVTESTILDQYS